MKFCSSCGEAMADNAMFCTKCGAKTGGDGAVVAANLSQEKQQSRSYSGSSVEKSFFEKYLSFDVLFSFSGRMNRKPYIIVGLLVSFLGGIIGAIIEGLFGEIMAGIYYLILLIPSFAITARRLHDINLSAWYMCVGWVIAIIGAVMTSETVIGLGGLVILGLSLALLFLKGTNGPNKYGADPLQ